MFVLWCTIYFVYFSHFFKMQIHKFDFIVSASETCTKNTMLNRIKEPFHTRLPHFTSTSLLNGYGPPTTPAYTCRHSTSTPLTNSPGHPLLTCCLLSFHYAINVSFKTIYQFKTTVINKTFKYLV